MLVSGILGVAALCVSPVISGWLDSDTIVADKTIYQVLADDPAFSRVMKGINFDEKTASLLNDSSASITFFAPDNRALPPPPHRKKDFVVTDEPVESFAAALERIDQHDDEEKKKILKWIIHEILTYHVLPTSVDASGLSANTTFATALKAHDGSFGGQLRRVRVETGFLGIGKGITINTYAKVKRRNIKASNGIIHVLNHPLFPPISLFEQLFLLQGPFSTLTSSLSRVNLTKYLEYRYIFEKMDGTFKGHFEGEGKVATLFAPGNGAFARLPPRLRFFLFSTFGEPFLKRILQYHIVPGIVAHADWLYNDTAGVFATFDHGPMLGFARTTVAADGFGGLLPAPYDLEDRFNGWAGTYDAMPSWDSVPTFEGDIHVSSPPYLDLASMEVPEQSIPHQGHTFHMASDDEQFLLDPHPPHLPRHEKHKHKKHHRKLPQPIYSANLTLPTLIGGDSVLHVHVARFKSKLPHGPPITTIFVNGRPITFVDGVARNGAIHVLPRLLNPFKKGPRHGKDIQLEDYDAVLNGGFFEEQEMDEWEDWEDWMPRPL